MGEPLSPENEEITDSIATDGDVFNEVEGGPSVEEICAEGNFPTNSTLCVYFPGNPDCRIVGDLNTLAILKNLNQETRDMIQQVYSPFQIQFSLDNMPACQRFIALQSPNCEEDEEIPKARVEFEGSVAVLKKEGYDFTGESGRMVYQDFRNACGEFSNYANNRISAWGFKLKPTDNYSEAQIEAMIVKGDFDQLLVEFTVYAGEFEITLSGTEVKELLREGQSKKYSPKVTKLQEFLTQAAKSDQAAEDFLDAGTITTPTPQGPPDRKEGSYGCNIAQNEKQEFDETLAELMQDPVSVFLMSLFAWRVTQFYLRNAVSDLLRTIFLKK